MENRKVVIIGDGYVGSTTAYTLLLHEAVNEVVIVDINMAKAEGDALDMNHGMSFLSPKKVRAGIYADCKDAHIIVITAGVAQKEGETRPELLKRNIRVFDSIIEGIRNYLDEKVIILVVTNPVDVLSYYTYKKLGIPSQRIIGSGTVLDTARLKAIIAENTEIDPRNIHTYVVGEHGDSEVSAFSVTSVAGMNINEYCNRCPRCRLLNNKLACYHQKVSRAAYEIIEKKGATYYAVALSVNKIIETILNNQNSVLTVSVHIESMFEGQVKDVYMSLPVILNAMGVQRILELSYSENEVKDIIKSADVIKNQINTIY